MFTFPVMLFIMFVMTAVQISVWQLFPEKLRDICFANPIFAFLLNLAGSGLIVAFTGVASFVGICNLGASVLFGVYAWYYAKKKNIKGLAIVWRKLFGIIPVIPGIVVVYDRNGEQFVL